MPRKREAPKDGGLHRLTVMVPAEMADALGAEADSENRPLSEIVRRRLAAESIAGGESLPPRAHAIRQLIAYASNEMLRDSPPGVEHQNVREGLARLLTRLDRSPKLADAKTDPEMMADYCWLTLWNARSRTYHEGKAMPLTPEQRMLSKIADTLLPDREKDSRPTKERKR
jgi:hypothetical protein